MTWNPRFLLITEIDLFLRNIWNFWQRYKEIINELEKARKEGPKQYRLAMRNATGNEFLLLINKLEALPLPPEDKCKWIKRIFHQGIHDTIKECAAIIMLDDENITNHHWGGEIRLVKEFSTISSEQSYANKYMPPAPDQLFESIRPGIDFLREKYKQKFSLVD
jgi:hypothetical protein